MKTKDKIILMVVLIIFGCLQPLIWYEICTLFTIHAVVGIFSCILFIIAIIIAVAIIDEEVKEIDKLKNN